MDRAKEKELLVDLLGIIEKHPAGPALARHFLVYIEGLKQKQLACDPYTEADDIQRVKVEIETITRRMVDTIDNIVNWDEYTDQPIVPRKFKLTDWFKQLLNSARPR